MTEKKAEMGSNISNNVSNSAINYASNNVSNDLSNDENHSTDYLKMEAISLSNSKAGDSTLARNYNLETLDVELKVPSYELPLNREKITNYENFSSKVPLNESALKKLENNGFVV